VPVEYLKREWKARRLNPRVQLTMTGCLGPCDLVNVVGILSADGMAWLGGLIEPWHFEMLLDWASAVHEAGHPLPLPASLAAHRLSRFPSLVPPPPAPPLPVTSDAA
jgi:cobaltochelatase CobN